ncbi:MAG: hypothetical protein M3Q39_16020 [Actinomycetota bacterium]|nr:hypothetical protein [Actinomycetota bacterium]
MAYRQPLQVVETESMRERIFILARREGVSQAQVIRDILRAGIDAREHDEGPSSAGGELGPSLGAGA